jgi:hypothetical protein
VDGLDLATTITTPGVDTSVPTEKAVRDAIAAAGGVGTVYGSAQYLGYLIPLGTTGTASTGAQTALVTRYIQINVPAPAIFNRITFQVATAAGATECGGGNCGFTFGLYGADNNLIANSVAAAAAPGSTGAKMFTMTGDTTLPGGTYWLGYATNSPTLVIGGTTAGFFGSAIVNAGLSSTTYRMFEEGSAGASGTGATVTLPSTVPASGRVLWNPTYVPTVGFFRN